MVKVEIDLPDLPEGYEYTGEYRYARMGEYYARDGFVACCVNGFGTCTRAHIVRKIKTHLDPGWYESASMRGIAILVGDKTHDLEGGHIPVNLLRNVNPDKKIGEAR